MKPRSACWSRKAWSTSASCWIGAPASIARRTGGRHSVARPRTAVRRVLHAGDATGREIGRVLGERVSALPSVTTIHHALVTELLVEGGQALGVRYFDRDGRPHEVRARATLLATGGAGQVFSETTNPPVATGDGIALAYHAGARLADLEFVQFHPTALNLPDAPRFLISEALRGEGARLVDGQGEAFMARYHPDGDLAPRDVVARSIVREVERTHGAVFLTPGSPRRRLRAAPVSDHRGDVRSPRPGPGSRSDPRRPGRALHHGRRRYR